MSAKEIKALVDIGTTTGYTGDVHVTLAYRTSYHGVTSHTVQ